MPRRSDLTKILVLGSGPIRIGQACEFDYSGTQACKALAEEGYQVVLVNSNPATIMTDPDIAWRTYVEPLTREYVEEIIARERPQALLPTMGGQTALNIAVELADAGVLDKYHVELIGARLDSIKVAEDRALFRAKMIEIGMPLPQSLVIRSLEELNTVGNTLPLPTIVRAAFTLGGTGSGIATTPAELLAICRAGLDASPAHEVLLEESVIGWKEIELEVVRDKNDNFIVVCGIENIDPMGVHTGDSVTVAPIQTLSDREYQTLRNAAKRIISAIGIDCGGSNIQFAIHPGTGEFVVIEMNPRVSRSSALASKATGYPIAKVAAKLSVGFSLDEIVNDVAGISACFEPSVDYVVTKIPRFNFDKFYGAADNLGTAMKSVGEAMAIGATFKESAQKALRSLELGLSGFTAVETRNSSDRKVWLSRLSSPTRYRLMDLWGAFAVGLTNEEIFDSCGLDPWFVETFREIWQTHEELIAAFKGLKPDKQSFREFFNQERLRLLKASGFSDRQLAQIFNQAMGKEVLSEDDVFALRNELEIAPVFKSIDTCAAEFPTNTRYLYSTYADTRVENEPIKGRKVIILGSGPNRIGQAIEFDYCCVQASLTLKEKGVSSIIINCNPETVSTDFDVSDSLYFEPLTLEDVSNIAACEKPDGIIVQFGGQTPLNLAHRLEKRGFRILGTSCEATALAEDRAQFRQVLARIGLMQPTGAIAHNYGEAVACADMLGYPVVLRPSFVLGGKSMYIIGSREHLEKILAATFRASPGAPLLIDQFLNPAIELDVDAVSDGSETVIAGVMEHIEEAGVHSGDSSCVLPPRTLSPHTISDITLATEAIARELKVVGLMNVQYAIKDGQLYVLEVNPRASRTVPFVSKATGIAWANIATRVIMGERLKDLRHLFAARNKTCAVKSVTIPFDRFPEAMIMLGPEMRSTGEVMGVAPDFSQAFLKAQTAIGKKVPSAGRVFVSAGADLLDEARRTVRAFKRAGLKTIVNRDIGSLLEDEQVESLPVDGRDRSALTDWLRQSDVARTVSLSPLDQVDELQASVRRASVTCSIPLTLTFTEAMALADSISRVRAGDRHIVSLQELHAAADYPPVENQFSKAPEHAQSIKT